MPPRFSVVNKKVVPCQLHFVLMRHNYATLWIQKNIAESFCSLFLLRVCADPVEGAAEEIFPRGDRVDTEAMFDPEITVNLRSDLVKKCTEWPTHDHSIKIPASFLGFHWRDTRPSTADSIDWYHR